MIATNVLNENLLRYEWLDNWAGQNCEVGFSHNDIAIDSQGRIYVSFNTEPYLRVFDREGNLLDSFNLSGPTMHCLLITQDAGGEWLWNIDLVGKRLSKSTLEGQVLYSIGRDAFGVGDDEKLEITAVAWDPDTGNMWVADGYGYAREGNYGGNFIYCFGPDLTLRFRFDGSNSPCGTFKEPHWIFADRRKGVTEIYIADRRNHRLVVFSSNGHYLRTISGDFNTPSGLAAFEDKLVVSELEGRIHILDNNDNIIMTLADGSEYRQCLGWPNRTGGHGASHSPLKYLEIGKLNSPHGIAADRDGNIYIHEWMLGARITKLKRLQESSLQSHFSQ